MRSVFVTIVLLLLILQALRLPLQSVALEVQRDYIARTYCVNLDEPELLCSGQCFIDQRLSETIKEDMQDVPTPQITLDWEISQYLSSVSVHWSEPTTGRPSHGWVYTGEAGQEYAYLPFAPPRCFA